MTVGDAAHEDDKIFSISSSRKSGTQTVFTFFAFTVFSKAFQRTLSISRKPIFDNFTFCFHKITNFAVDFKLFNHTKIENVTFKPPRLPLKNCSKEG